MRLVDELTEDVFNRILEFCDTLIKIFFANEATFYSSDYVHRQIVRYWYTNTRRKQEYCSLRPAGIKGKKILGLYFFDENIISVIYLQFR